MSLIEREPLPEDLINARKKLMHECYLPDLAANDLKKYAEKGLDAFFVYFPLFDNDMQARRDHFLEIVGAKRCKTPEGKKSNYFETAYEGVLLEEQQNFANDELIGVHYIGHQI